MKILIIDGHPDEESYCRALGRAYADGAQSSTAEVKTLVIADLDFNINLQYGYRKRTELEPDLLKAQELLKWADHIVWVYPVWWGSVPAIMKGFLDRVLLPSYAFTKIEGSMVKWDQHFSGRTARLISTMDQPTWFYRWINGRPSTIAMTRLTMNFIGIKKVRTTSIGPIRLSTDQFRRKWLEKVRQLGKANK